MTGAGVVGGVGRGLFQQLKAIAGKLNNRKTLASAIVVDNGLL